MGSRWRCSVALLLAPLWILTSVGPPPSASFTPAAEGDPPRAESRPQPFYERPFGHQFPVSVTSSTWRITLSDSVACDRCPGGKAWVFTAVRKDNDESYKIRLTNSPTQVDELDIVRESRLVIFGRNTADAVLVNIVELPKGGELDNFMCYDPVLSFDHRFVAYLKPFPGHPGPIDITNEYAVYDLTESAASNRLHLKDGIVYDAGIPVYPPGATNATGEFAAPDEWSAHVIASAGLFWLSQTDKVAFVDRWRGTDSLVIADVGQGLRQPKLNVQALNTGNMVDMADCRDKVAPSDFENWSKDPAVLIAVTDIFVASSGGPEVRLTLAPHPCLTSTVVDVPIEVR